MDLSIIIVNWNTSSLLRKCIDSIYRSESKLSFEIIVVDNGSTDNSVTLIKDNYPQVQIISNIENRGFARANNQGLQKAIGRYFLLLNSDAMVKQNALDNLVGFADFHPVIGIVGPKLLNPDDTLQESCYRFPTLISEIFGRQLGFYTPVTYSSVAYETDWVMGACMLVRAKAVNDAGMLDEDYFMYSEELDWCFRIKRRGWKICYLESAEVYHIGGGSASRTNLNQLVRLYSSKILFFHKNYNAYFAVMLRYGLILANIYGLVRRIFYLPGKNRETMRERIVIQGKLVWALLSSQYSVFNR